MTDPTGGVAARHERWAEVVNARSVTGYADLLTEDAVWIPPARDAIRGRGAITAWLRPLFERYEYDFALIDPRWRGAGDWVVERGRFATRLRSSGSDEAWSLTHGGAYVVLWRLDGSRVWRIDRYVDLDGLVAPTSRV